METEGSRILAVPTNIITGFLGAGKTTAILNLLQHKPDDERWAVLVNEFGEIGVDGSILQGQQGEDGGVHVREVPGGCMCCTAGLPMQIALTQLLSRARPHRLLIEPTGLGHPLEVLQTLSADYNREVLSIHKTLTLVDARNLADARYTDHGIFRQQMEIADVVVANKEDLYTADDRRNLQRYVESHCQPGIDVTYTQFGRITPDLLQGPTATKAEAAGSKDKGTLPLLAAEQPFPECGFVTAINQGEGFESIGWRFSPEKVFDRERLFALLCGLDVERLKAVFITEEGIRAYNMTRDALTETELDDCIESRIEIICDRIDAAWEEKLTRCIASEVRTYSS